MKLFVVLLTVALAGVVSAQTQEYEIDVPVIIAGSAAQTALTIDRDQLLKDLETLNGEELAKSLEIVKAIIELSRSDLERTIKALKHTTWELEARSYQHKMKKLNKAIEKWTHVLDKYTNH